MKHSIFTIVIALFLLTSCNKAFRNNNQSLQAKNATMQPTLMHIGIAAIDIDSTVAFYKNVFGYNKRYEYTKSTNIQSGQVTYEGRAVFIDLGGDTYIELFPFGKRGQTIAISPVFHFALIVNSVDETYKKALQFGAKKFGFPGWDGTPVTISMKGEPTLKERIAFVEGLNGELIELYELLTPVTTKEY
jgi:catechol 2,3-dioxygenase-like lactoylglutathione lyase family enzyme